MLQHAAKTAAAGKYVMVVMQGPQDVKMAVQDVAAMLGETPTSDDKVYTKDGGQVVFVATPDRLHLDTGHIDGAPPNVEIVMDHFVLEAACWWAFRQWVRWSDPAPERPTDGQTAEMEGK